VTTLVLSGRGKTGRRVAERLAARGLPVRVGSRSGDPPFDWDRPPTWPLALHGVDSVYVAYHPDLAFPTAARAIGGFAGVAAASGVRRLVMLSRRGEEGAALSEGALREAGAEWTIVRASWLSQCFSEGRLLEPVLAGEVALPARQIGEPFVDADDVADVAVAALTEEGHDGRVYEVTGPRLLTFAEAVEEIAAAAGREIRYARISMAEYASVLARHRVPPIFASLLRYLFAEVLDGRNAHLADGVQRAIGRKPRDFADYARAAAASGIWIGINGRRSRPSR
jgi:uncharacterized protein YbjT (DUF2867 family)